MRPQTAFLLLMVVAAMVLGVAASGTAATAVLAGGHGPVAPALPGVPRVACERPRALRLIRFEDGSARLECGRRLLVRVSGSR